MMENIRPIRNEADYQWALKEVSLYFENEPALGTAEADRFDVLADLIEAYENRYWPIGDLDPITLIKAHMDNSGRTPDELAELLGSTDIAADVLARKQPLTVPMIQALTTAWHLPADTLVAPYELAADALPAAL